MAGKQKVRVAVAFLALAILVGVSVGGRDESAQGGPAIMGGLPEGLIRVIGGGIDEAVRAGGDDLAKMARGGAYDAVRGVDDLPHIPQGRAPVRLFPPGGAVESETSGMAAAARKAGVDAVCSALYTVVMEGRPLTPAALVDIGVDAAASVVTDGIDVPVGSPASDALGEAEDQLSERINESLGNVDNWDVDESEAEKAAEDLACAWTELLE
jgi:hypothetical protein